MRIRTAHFPTVKTLEDFNLDHLPSLRRDVLAHLATSTYVAKAENVILLGPPGLGKTHLAIGLGVKATQAGHSVLFDTASNWITRLAEAHHAGRLEAEPKKIPQRVNFRKPATPGGAPYRTNDLDRADAVWLPPVCGGSPCTAGHPRAAGARGG